MKHMRAHFLRLLFLGMFIAQSNAAAIAGTITSVSTVKQGAASKLVVRSSKTTIRPFKATRQSTKTAIQISSIKCDENSKLFEGLSLPTYVWSNGNKHPDLIVLGLHGGCLHGRSYDGLGKALAKRNYVVVSTDMRGYGKWYFDQFGTEKDKTFDYERSLVDIESILARLRSIYPNTPIYCIGESLGANVALVLATEKPELVDGVVLVSPYAHIKMFLSARMLLNLAQVTFAPTSKLNLSPYFRNRLSNREDRIEEHFRDPMSRDHQSINELRKSLNINHRGIANATDLPRECPVLMIVGEQDKLTSPKAAIKLFDKIPSEDKQLWLRKESAHVMLETESIEAPVVSTISRWLHRTSDSAAMTASIAKKNERM